MQHTATSALLPPTSAPLPSSYCTPFRGRRRATFSISSEVSTASTWAKWVERWRVSAPTPHPTSSTVWVDGYTDPIADATSRLMFRPP